MKVRFSTLFVSAQGKRKSPNEFAMRARSWIPGRSITSKFSMKNAAMRLGRRDLGLIAPGRRADFFLTSDLQALRVEDVFA